VCTKLKGSVGGGPLAELLCNGGSLCNGLQEDTQGKLNIEEPIFYADFCFYYYSLVQPRVFIYSF